MSKIIKASTVTLAEGTVNIAYTPPKRPDSFSGLNLEGVPLAEMEQADELLQVTALKAREIVQKATDEAIQAKMKILGEASEEADTIRQQAYDKGYAQGTQEGVELGRNQSRQLISDNLNHLEQVVGECRYEAKKFYREYEQSLISLAIDVAAKVLNHKVEEDDMVLVDLVKEAMDSIKNSRILSISVSDKMLGLLAYLQENIGELTSQEHPVEIEEKDMQGGGFLIETDNEVIDISVNAQIENIRQFFTSM